MEVELKELETSLARAYSISGDPELVDVDEHAECYGDIQKLIEREIERQSVTDEEIREVIDWFERENKSLSEDVEDLRETIEKYPFEKMSYSKNTKDWRPFKIKALTSRVERNELAIQALQLFGKSEEPKEPCEWCSGEQRLVCYKVISPTTRVLVSKTNYCPNCGRKL